MLWISSTNIWVTSYPLVVSPLSKLHSPTISFDLYIPRFDPTSFYFRSLCFALDKPSQYSLSLFIILLIMSSWVFNQVRPNAVALVDSFNYTDHYLGSVLGRYDGNVYPKLYEEAWKDPLNELVVPDGYQEYVRPLLKQQLRNSRLWRKPSPTMQKHVSRIMWRGIVRCY